MKIDSASLSNQNATAFAEKAVAALQAGDTTFDFAAVKEVDSAAVAFMLALQREAQARKQTLQWVNVPQGIQSLAKLYGVESLIGLHHAPAQ